MKQPLLITMQGPRGLPDISQMSNFEAGIATLVLLDKVYPGIRFRDLPGLVERPESMAGWWTDLKKATSSVKDGIGDVLKSTYTTVAGGVGDAVRLVTDEKVIDGASRLGTAYATGGGSEGLRAISSQGGPLDSLISFVSNLGQQAKTANVQTASVGGVNASILPWAIGGGLLLVLLAGRR